MPPELFQAPDVLSPRNEQRIAGNAQKTKERREEILQTGRIEQLEAENDMLKEQIRTGRPANSEELGKISEEKARLLQLQVDEKD